MMSILDQARAQIAAIVARAAGAVGAELAAAEVKIEMPKEQSFGEFSVNTAMQLARQLKQNPRAIAEDIVKGIDTQGTYIQAVEIAGAGFINFRLSHRYYEDVVKEILARRSEYGKSNIGMSKRVIIEFVSANPTGPVHIGNARGGAVGDVLAEVMAWAGYDVYREFYVNDAGNQVAKFGASLEARYLEMFGRDFTFPEDGYVGDYIKDIALEYAKEHSGDLLEVASDERQRTLAQFGLALNIADMEQALERYGITYDNWFRESSLYENDKVPQAVELIRQKGYTYEKDGALWFEATRLGCDKDFVLVRSNGTPTYITPDIAYHVNKLIERNFDIAIDILGADHHGYVPRLSATMEAAGVGKDRLHIVLTQFVRLVRRKEVVKMSKRKGEIITLSDLVSEVGKDAARFLFNLYNPNTHMDFDLDLAVEKSNDNPVFYVQYAHARICSIIRQCEEERVRSEPDMSLLQEDAEIALIRILARFGEEIILAAQHFDTSRIPKYAVELAAQLHTFYNSCRVRVEDEALMAARIALITAVEIVLKNALDILGIDAPEQM